jgi:Nicotinate phosphoribosyltransferase (NAPRTase) N-terminal domain
MNSRSSALLTDLYQLTMLQGYFHEQMEETAVFEFFVRRLPPCRNFLVAAGLEQERRWMIPCCRPVLRMSPSLSYANRGRDVHAACRLENLDAPCTDALYRQPMEEVLLQREQCILF